MELAPHKEIMARCLLEYCYYSNFSPHTCGLVPFKAQRCKNQYDPAL